MKDISFVDDLDDKVYDSMDDKNNPFCNDDDMKKKPSIFTGFNEQVDAMIESQFQRELRMQRNRTGKNYKSLNLRELKKFKDGKQREKDEKVVTFSKAGREKALFAETQKIEEMNALMKRANRLKSPSRAFSKMSNAMNALEEYKNSMLEKAGNNIPLGKDDYEGYEARLNELNKATKEYIQKKGITPKTEKGRERLDAAMSIENRVEDLIRNFETEKKRDEKEVLELKKDDEMAL